jgi:uncharacterized hydrophobic protein (TIGR00271 family)
MSRSPRALGAKRVTPRAVGRVRDALLFDRGNVRDKYSAFFLMLALSSVIATGGIVTDSTAVVVGAMIIAPLMTPILATALSTVTGDGRNAIRSLLIAAGGTALVVAVAALITRLAPSGVQLAGNTQVAARTAPRVIDLVIALAAGAAGAFAIARQDVPEVLPGVAVSISIVPPLCVAGAALVEGSPQLAGGALLLFATNFFAILLAAVCVFAAMGFTRIALREYTPHARIIGIAVIVVGTLLLLAPLAATSGQIVREATLERAASSAVGDWLSGTGYQLFSMSVKDFVVTVQITGKGAPPKTADLAKLLSSGNPRPSLVRVLILPQEVAFPQSSESAVPAVSSSEATVPASSAAASTPAAGALATQAVPASGTATGAP